MKKKLLLHCKNSRRARVDNTHLHPVYALTRKRCIQLGLLFLFLCTGLCGTGQAQEYTLSMLPRYFPEKIKAMMTPLAQYLSEQTGQETKITMMSNFDQYEHALKDNKIDIGYENPLIYVNVSASHEVLATAVKGSGGNKFRGIIIVRSDSDIDNVSKLQDKTIMRVGKTSAGGFLSQELYLKENGVAISQDHLVEAADNRQENVLIAVSIGEVDAGFIRESALHKADKYIVPGSIKVLTPTTWLPNWAFSVSRQLPYEQKEAIRQALLSLKKESKVLKAMGLTGIQSASDSDYDIMRTFRGSL